MTAKAAPSPWIIDAPRDLLLFVATPLLILPLVHLASQRWSAEGIYLTVASFGALGHHLPGMMRAYGDRALFERFKVRFIVAPLFLVAVCVGFAMVSLSVVLLVVFLWGMWHFFMQTHGFLRIYDSKRACFARRTAWLDFAACMTWFPAALAFSDTRWHFFLEHFYAAGGVLVQPSWIEGIRLLLAGATAVVTIAYLVNAVLDAKAGRPQSHVKHLLLVTSIAFFWYANVAVANLLLAVVLFELFHDVQYLTIVWLFNRKRVDTDPGVGGFTRFLFRKRAALVLLYLGLIFAYGSLNLANEHLLSGTSFQVMAGLLAASGLLHFYYDGFIWKMRERETRQALGLEGGAAVRTEGFLGFPGWARHGLRWAVFVVPLTAFGFAVAAGTPDEDDKRLLLATSLPEDVEAQRNRAVVLYKRGDKDGAASAYEKALGLSPRDEAAASALERDLGATLVQLALDDLRAGRAKEAGEHLLRARGLDDGLAERVFQAGVAAGRAADHPREEAHYRAALMLDESHGPAAFNLAATLQQRGANDEALTWVDRAAELLPDDPRPEQLRRIIFRGPTR
jgi:tetratricopeptide (TPR) repeat protein